MSSLRDYFNRTQKLKFEPRPCKALEVWFMGDVPSLFEYDLEVDDIEAWIDQVGQYQAPSINQEQCALRLLHQQWSMSEAKDMRRKFPFAPETFYHMSNAFDLSPEYLQLFRQEFTPLHISFPSSTRDHTELIIQSPKFREFCTLTLSYNAKTGTTLGFLGYSVEDDADRFIIDALKASLPDSRHPLFLPVIFFRFWLAELRSDNNAREGRFKKIKQITRRVEHPDWEKNSTEALSEAHELIIKTHDRVNNGMKSFLAAAAGSLSNTMDRINEIVSSNQMEVIHNTHTDIEALILVWSNELSGQVDYEKRLNAKLSMHLQVLYNLMQQAQAADSKRIAENSNRIAVEARADNKAMKEIAEFTQLESVAMRTVAAISMVFLPGTAIAAILSMGSFFEVGATGSIVISTKFWIYWILAIPATLLVLGSWWLWTRRIHNHILAANKKDD